MTATLPPATTWAPRVRAPWAVRSSKTEPRSTMAAFRGMCSTVHAKPREGLDSKRWRPQEEDGKEAEEDNEEGEEEEEEEDEAAAVEEEEEDNDEVKDAGPILPPPPLSTTSATSFSSSTMALRLLWSSLLPSPSSSLSPCTSK